MISKILFLLTVLATIDKLRAGHAEAEPDNTQKFVGITHYDDCEGKDAANITILDTLTRNQFCDRNQAIPQVGNNRYIVVCTGSVRKVVQVKELAESDYPAGAFTQSDTLWEALSGPWEGKFIYEKVIYLEFLYLKKCSSILGYSYVTSKSAILLINDKLDVNVLISPTGGFEQFKKGCTTICKGRNYWL